MEEKQEFCRPEMWYNAQLKNPRMNTMKIYKICQRSSRITTFFENAAKGFISSSYIFLYLDSTSEVKPLSRSSGCWKWQYDKIYEPQQTKRTIIRKRSKRDRIAMKHPLWSSRDHFFMIVILDITNLSVKFDIISFCLFQLHCKHPDLLLQPSYFLAQ